MLSEQTLRDAETPIEACIARGVQPTTAESLTGGPIAAALTSVAGSSAVVDRGFVVYSNDAKHRMLGVSTQAIQEYGAVSEPVAKAMAEGALERSRARIAIAVASLAQRGQPTATATHMFPGERTAIRAATAAQAFAAIRARV
ncbi:MAG: nicotinamide-nucleotide amidohydrolase family protein [Rhodospirillales bacterium]